MTFFFCVCVLFYPVSVSHLYRGLSLCSLLYLWPVCYFVPVVTRVVHLVGPSVKLICFGKYGRFPPMSTWGKLPRSGKNSQLRLMLLRSDIASQQQQSSLVSFTHILFFSFSFPLFYFMGFDSCKNF